MAVEPPETRRDPVVEHLHGDEVTDPYRWLEDTDADEVRDWIERQNAVTSDHLSQLPGRERIRATVRELWDHPRRSVPWRRGAHWFQLRNDGLQDQDVLWTADGEDSGEEGVSIAPPDLQWRVLLDPNRLSDEGTISLTGTAVSDDGALLAYALSEAGSDWRTWRVREVATGEDRDDEVRWSKFAPAAWLPDSSGFLYGAYDPPEEGREFEAKNLDMRLMLHRLGTPTTDDELVHHRPDQPEWGYWPKISHDGAWLILVIWKGTERENRVHLAPIDDDGGIGEVTPLLDDFDASYVPLGIVGERLYLHTDRDAPNGRVVAVRLDDAEDVVEVVPQTDDSLEEVRIIGGAGPDDPGWLVASYLHHATSRLAVLDLDGAHLCDLELPGLGTAGDPRSREESLAGGRRDTAVHFSFETFTSPPTVLRHDLVEGTTVEVSPAGLPSGEEFTTEQVFVESDGVRVPLFLVRRADLEPTGDVPTLLWGYGGFSIAVTPHFRTPWRAWVELGGLLAIACLRGGGEYGKEWHDAGRLANKQHVFDDAIACAEWLTGEGGWTSTDRIGIEGRSNGGLLVGACMTQRPDLWGCAVPEVGVLDMLRFHRFTIGWGWVSDYGSADDPEQYGWLRAYSPYHNLSEGTCYPPTLLTTGDHDDRVVPGHSFKFAAALQHAQGCDAPTLIRIDTSAGHGVGKPVSKLVDERTDVIAFEAHHLGLEL